MTELFSMPFMLRAMLAGILVGFLASYYGVFVVQRRMSFLGSGLAHAAFGGVALGLFLHTEPLYIAVPFTIIVAVGIVFLKEKTRLETDTSIGILFSVAVALGIIFLAMKRDYTVDAFTYLFGSILSVFTGDLIFALILTIITIFATFKYWSSWAYSTFDSELAQSDRIPVPKHDYILSVLIALSIVISVKLVGIILISAFIVIPAASARLLATTFIKMTIISIIIGVLSALAGLILSYMLDLPSGAVIILLQATIFLICALARKSR